MWKHNINTSGHNRSRSPMKSIQSVQNLSPFCGHSSAESSASTSSPSELPSGVRYIRQTASKPNGPYRWTTTPSDRRRDKSPTKTLRFAEPTVCSKNHEKIADKTNSKANTVTKKPLSEKPRIVRPVISADSTPDNTPVAVSPASRQASPIFSTVDFGSKPSSNKEPNSWSKSMKQSNGKTAKDMKHSSASAAKEEKCCSVKAAKGHKFYTYGLHGKTLPVHVSPGEEDTGLRHPLKGFSWKRSDPKDSPQTYFMSSKTSPNSQPKGYKVSFSEHPLKDDNKSPIEAQTVIKTEIKGPNGAVKRSSEMTSNPLTNGAVHRNTLSFPLQSGSEQSSEHICDPNRLSVNVNVAVGVDCNDNHMKESIDNRFVGQKLMHRLSDESNYDEIDWTPRPENSSIQVAVRLRPFSKSEKDSHNDISVIDMRGNTVRIINADNDLYNRVEYGFEECLNSTDRDLFEFANQDRVFNSMGRPLLDRAIEGYNVCLFAYGQTGSGKTYTMMGSENNPGIIPRFVHEMYKRFAALSDVMFTLDVSYCEIYNEKIYDLLSDDRSHNKQILRIREHPSKGPYVENLSEHAVKDEEDVMQLLRAGNRRRATASTAANKDSSRSHSIFTIVLSQMRCSAEMGLDVSCSCGSRINLIDLAGSERVGFSATTGDRLKEGSLINKSLFNLGKVISKLADLSANPLRVTHIPYRDSTLTWLLKDSLGGNSRTSMIATISPAKCHLEETLSTLRYAATARRIVNFVHINEDPKSRRIRELMEEIAFLKSQQTDGQFMTPEKRAPIPEASDELINEEIIESKVETISRATNTSFVSNRRTSTKGTDTSVSHIEKKSCSIATNTSFITKPKTCSTGTEIEVFLDPKPITVSTGTEMSFIETKETATEMRFRVLPTPMDLLRAQQLEEEQKKLLKEIDEQRKRFMRSNPDNNSGHQGFKANGNEESGERSDTPSEKYYECEDVFSKTECIPELGETDVGVDTVDDNDGNWGQGGDQEWGTGGDGDKEWGTGGEWGTSDGQKDKKSFNISVGNAVTSDPKDSNTQEEGWDEEETQQDGDNQTDWEQNENKDTNWGSDEPKDDNNWTEEPNNEWNDNNDTNDDNSRQKEGDCSDWGTGGQTQNKDNLSKADNEWGTDWGTGGQTQNKDNSSKADNEWNNGWGTDGHNQSEDKSDEKDGAWGGGDDWGTGDQNNGEENKEANEEFDWGSDKTETTVIDSKAKDCGTGCDNADEDWG